MDLRVSNDLSANVKFQKLSLTAGLTAAVLATEAAIQKKIVGSRMTTLIFSNEELDDIMKWSLWGMVVCW